MKKEKCIIVGVNLNNQEGFENSMEELKNLTMGLDIEVCEELTQNLKQFNMKTYIGYGKLNELKSFINFHDADLVIFNDELSGSQIKNIEYYLKCPVLDRTQVILDTFTLRANTKEAKVQIELARLKYRLPRLIGLRDALPRQRGGGVTNRGAGETKLELDRRSIKDRIRKLEEELRIIVTKRETQRRLRRKNDIPTVALVGYTNSGKSTLLNSMIEFHNREESKKVFEKDMLFATLDTAVRNITLEDHKQFLLTDTVGFIDKLPHDLVIAFRSTLEEVIEADLLIHVVDYSNPYHKQQIEITNKTLEEIGIVNVPMIIAFNKIDKIGMQEARIENNTIYLSAKEKYGFIELIELIREQIFRDYVSCEMLIPFENSNLINYFIERANVLHTTYEFNGTKIKLECRQADFDRYNQYVIS